MMLSYKGKYINTGIYIDIFKHYLCSSSKKIGTNNQQKRFNKS